jgi:hypothetical protein
MTLDGEQKVPDKETVKAMLRREKELRLSVPVQNLLDDGMDNDTVSMNVQKQVAREFGYGEAEEQEGVQVLRCAMSLYGSDPEVRSIPFYVKYNRSEQGQLIVGDTIPDVPLATIAGGPCRLSEFIMPSQPMVLVGGSYT